LTWGRPERPPHFSAERADAGRREDHLAELGWEIVMPFPMRTHAQLALEEVLLDRIQPLRSHDHDESGVTTPVAGTVRLSGRSRENKLVHISGTPDLLARRVTVRVDRVGPYALAGTLGS